MKGISHLAGGTNPPGQTHLGILQELMRLKEKDELLVPPEGDFSIPGEP